MIGFTTVPVEMQVTGSQLDQLVEQVRTAAGPLRTEAAELLDGSWHGGAAAGFAAGWREWLHGLGEVLTALEGFAEQTSAAGRAYTATDDQGADVLLAAAAPR